MIKIAICLSLSLAISTAHAFPRLSWRADVDRIQPVRGSVYRGETLALSCQLIRAGTVMDLSGLSASIFWQTNGMGSAWWSAPATAGTNGVTATFRPDMQPSADQILFFLGVADSDQRHAYRATGIIRLLHSPGAEPNVLPLPQLSLDFNKVTVTNAPWLEVETDPIFTEYAQVLNPWIDSVDKRLAGLDDIPPVDALLSADNSTPNRLASAWNLLAGSSYYMPDFSLSVSNLVYQTPDRWEHGVRLDRDGLYLRRDRQQADLTAAGLYTLEPGEGATTYKADGVLHQGPYPKLVETYISYPVTGRDNEVFALRSDLIPPVTNAYLAVSNKTLSVISLTSDPPAEIWSSEESTAIDPATNALWSAVRAVDRRVDQVATAADPAWGKRLPDGTPNPDVNALFLNTPATIFAGGCSWSANGNYAVLTADGATAVATGTNATFRIGPNSASWFGYSEGGTVVVGARANSLVVGRDTVQITYPYDHGDFPTLWFTGSLLQDFLLVDSPLWVDNQDGTATATVSKPNGAGFWKATTAQTIDSKFQTTMPAEFSGGVIGSTNALPVIYDSVIEIEVSGRRYRIPAQAM